jgi:NADH-quinone oxidoreductase subunit F
MMAVGIPAFRLPREPLNFEIEGILRAGIEVKTGVTLGRDFSLDSLFARGYRAVILAIGAHKSRRLDIPGEDLQGVVPGTDFLRAIALNADKGTRGQGDKETFNSDVTASPGHPVALSQLVEGKRVALVGGGDVAIDAARSAWRLGAQEVHLVYRREREQMPAYPDQVKAAEEEGVIFHFLTVPIRVLGDDRVTGVECQRQTLGEFDRDGRRRPVAQADRFTLNLDVLISAIGQETELDADATPEIARNPESTFAVNAALATTREGVFAAGDAVTGPATVVNAVAQGNEVARAVDHYLRTGQVEKLVTAPGYQVVEQRFDVQQYVQATRPPVPMLPLAGRRGSFAEVEQSWDERTVQEECKRCLRCDLEWLLEMQLPPQAQPERMVGSVGTER